MSARIRSNDRMPPRTALHIDRFLGQVRAWRSPHRRQVLSHIEHIGPREMFEILHAMRRWYSGQTMARCLLSHRATLQTIMSIDPRDVVGVYRGFKVSKKSPLANLEVGDTVTLDVTRNHSFSSWSTTEEPTHRFSGRSKDKTGLIVRLDGPRDVVPVLAPPRHTEAWFNGLYSHTIGKSFRPKEGEYLIHAPRIDVVVVRVKR